MYGFGIPQEDIAIYLEIDVKTLRKYYRREMDTAITEVNSRVAQTLFQQATSGNTAAAIFWLKVRAGWSERPAAVAVAGKDGKVEISVVTGVGRGTDD